MRRHQVDSVAEAAEERVRIVRLEAPFAFYDDADDGRPYSWVAGQTVSDAAEIKLLRERGAQLVYAADEDRIEEIPELNQRVPQLFRDARDKHRASGVVFYAINLLFREFETLVLRCMARMDAETDSIDRQFAEIDMVKLLRHYKSAFQQILEMPPAKADQWARSCVQGI